MPKFRIINYTKFIFNIKYLNDLLILKVALILWFLDVTEDIAWLQHNIEPWQVVVEKWSKTFEIRQKKPSIQRTRILYLLPSTS